MRITDALALALAAWLVSCSTSSPPVSPPPGTIIGAIRWDAWSGDGTAVGAVVDKTLGPNQYHNRLPFYAQVTGTDSVVVNGASQATMDQEITYAHNAGLNYWAFDYYPDGSGLEAARELYMTSSLKQLVNFSFIINADGNPDIQTLVNWFADPSYQKVLNGRPLLYVLTAANEQSYISQLRTATTNAGLANPYVVLMGNAGDAVSIGADALTEYATNGSDGEPYASLVSDEIKWWVSVGQTMPIIPWVTSGWDPRPRIQNPVPWTTYPANSWVQEATPAEIASHLKDALNWIGSNPNRAPANAVLIYAWNEFDEGGWLCPTLSNDSDRLNAISQAH